jgi:hypothetical protein
MELEPTGVSSLIDVQVLCGSCTVVSGIHMEWSMNSGTLTHEHLACSSGYKVADICLQMDGHHGCL